jgi:hypothetical protein
VSRAGCGCWPLAPYPYCSGSPSQDDEYLATLRWKRLPAHSNCRASCQPRTQRSWPCNWADKNEC